MPHRALRLAVVAVAALFVSVTAHAASAESTTASDNTLSAEQLIAVGIRPARAYPEIRVPGLPAIQYSGSFSSTGQFRGNSRWDRLREAIDASFVCADASSCGIEPAKLSSRERDVKDYVSSRHAVDLIDSRQNRVGARDSAISFLYGRAHILRTPEYVAVDSRGHVIVSTPSDGSVHVLDPQGKNSFRIVGGKEYRLKSPAGIAVDKDDNIYVADAASGILLVYNRTGVFLRYIGLWRGENMYERPTAIAIDRRNERLYLADTPRNLVLQMDLNGRLLATFGKKHGRGTGTVSFDFPTQLGLADDGLLVLDDAGCRIQKLTFDGRLTYSRRLALRSRQEENAGDGMGTDGNGNIYISSIPDSTIRVFSPAGDLLGTFGQNGMRAGEFRSPKGLAVDSTSRIYVADSENNRVQVFQVGSKH